MSKKSQKIQVDARVIALGEESNDMYMSLDMVFLTSEVNLNNVQFEEDFIYGIEQEKEKYLGLPLVADLSMLESGKYDKLTHKFKKGKFGTQAIGSFVDFRTNKNGDVLELIASARVWKRNEKTCAALEELYASDEGLKFSYEILVGKYTVENGIKKVPKDDSNNPIGSCVVSTPAVPASRARLLIAEALEADFINDKNFEGGEIMERNQNPTVEEFFKNAVIKLNMAELDLSQIRKKIYNQLRSMLGDKYYYYDVVEMGVDYIILLHSEQSDYYKCDYTVSENEVTVSNMRQVTKTYQDVSQNSEGDDNMAQLAEIQAKLDAALAEVESLKSQITEKETALAEKEKEIAEANSKIETLSASVIEKDNIIKELEPFKAEVEKINAEKAEAELAQKKEKLKNKYSKLLSAEVMTSTEVAEAIENLNEDLLKNKVVEVALEKAEKKDEKKEYVTASKIIDDVKVGSSDVVSKYVTINR